MAAQSPRLLWPFPAEHEEPWWDAFKDFVSAVDASAFAAREDRNIILMGGGTIAFNSTSGVLSWSAQIEVFAPSSGFMNLVPAGSVTLADGQIFRALLTRAPGANVSVSSQGAASFAQNTDNGFVFCIRRGSSIYWRNGLLLTAGTPVSGLGITPAAGGPATMGGDVTGTTSAALVVALRGTPLVNPLSPASGNMLAWNGSAWAPAANAGDVTGAPGATVVARLRGMPIVSPLSPSSGDVLTWDGAAWDAATPAGGGGGAFIFRPGGVVGGQVYDTWTTLHAAVAAFDGEKIVLIDDSGAAAEVEVGAWDINGWYFKSFDPSSTATLTVLDGATFTPAPALVWTLDNVLLVGAHTSGYVYDTSTSFTHITVKNGGSIDGSATRPFIRIGGGGSQPNLTIDVRADGYLGQVNGNVVEVRGTGPSRGRVYIVFHDSTGTMGAASITQGGANQGAVTYQFYGTSTEVPLTQVGFPDTITIEQKNDMRYMAEVVWPFVIDAQQVGVTELHVGSVYLKAGTVVKGTSAAMLGGALVGDTANLVMKRFTGAVITGGIYTTVGTFAEAQPLGGEFTITASDWYDFYIYAGGGGQTAIIKGLRMMIVPSIENGL